MPVGPPDSGDTITTASIESMHNTLRTLINGLGVSNLGRHSLGPQHTPTIVVGWGWKDLPAQETLTYDPLGGPPDDRVLEETTADVTGGSWKTLTGFTLDNAGAGWTLPPCKVLFFIHADLSLIEGQLGVETMVWLCPIIERDTGTTEVEVLWMRQHHVPERVLEKSALAAGLLPHETDEPYAFVGLLDRTGAGGNWTLDAIKLKAGISRSSGGATPKTEAFIDKGGIGFIAFYKDA